MWNTYVNIPFKPNGRTLEGVDCWGLVRLVYSAEFSIELPSFSDDYTLDDPERLAELIKQYEEGWEKQDSPSIGDVILFNILGTPQHIGIYIGNNRFLHSLEGYSSVIDQLDSARWRSRVVGFYKYSARSVASLTAAPHPLRTESFTLPVPSGTSLKSIHEWILKEYKVPTDIQTKIVILLNGNVVPEDKFETTVVKDGDSVQYRALAGKSALKVFLFIALAIAVPMIVGAIGTIGGVALTTATGLTGLGAVVSFGLHTLGALLINAIAPVRPPAQQGDPGSANTQNLMSGVQNQTNPYGAIPVVLGRVRTSAVLGAQSLIDSGTDFSYLKSLLVWGFAPLRVSDIRIGATSIDQYDDVRMGHVAEGFSATNYLSDYELASMFEYDVKQKQVGTTLVNNPTDGNPWTEVTVLEPNTTGMEVNFHFPEGLRRIKTKGEDAGSIYTKDCQLEVQWRALDTTGTPIGSWNNSLILNVPATSIEMPTATYTITHNRSHGESYTTTHYGYRWIRFGITRSGQKVFKVGAVVESPYDEPANTASYRQRKNTSYNFAGVAAENVRLPAWSADVLPISDICVQGTNTTAHIVDNSVRNPNYIYANIGGPVYGSEVVWGWQNDEHYGLSSYRTIGWPAGTIYSVGNTTVLTLGIDNFQKRKDAFSYTHTIPIPNTGGMYQVRARRTNSDLAEPDDSLRDLHAVTLQYVTARTYRKKLNIPTNKFNITRTAISIKASDQLNSNMEGINAYVESICPDWDATSGIWVSRVTNNPASLFLWILRHQANAYKILPEELASRVNLPALQDWHTYCASKGFAYNNVVSSQVSIMDLLRDIAAAGRASPAVVDGKWTVIIDRPRTEVVQYFTPANSWGFEATKALPRMPDGLKVSYYNEEAGFQEDELIVYAPGKNISNSSVFERISLPGITRANLVYNHARWAIAQGMLRPETYVINTDMEYLVCSRGDRVKVVNEVPMWGLGSGRVISVTGGTSLELSEPIAMSASGTYLLRVRSSTGQGADYPIVTPAVDGWFSTITLANPVVDSQVSAGDLFMLGSVETDFTDLIVQSVEPFGQKNARITLVNYAAELYDINYLASQFTVPSYDPNVSKPPKILDNSINLTPLVTEIISDERVLKKIAPGVFSASIKVSVASEPTLPANVQSLLLEASTTNSTYLNPEIVIEVPVSSSSVEIQDVIEGTEYFISVRYKSMDGRLGPKSPKVGHTVVGKTKEPSDVTNLTVTSTALSGDILVSWNNIPDIDLQYYEVRSSNTGWGTDNNYLYRGLDTSTYLEHPGFSGVYTLYCKAVDTGNRYSASAAVGSYTIAPPQRVSGVAHTFPNQSPSDSSVRIYWTQPNSTSYAILGYKISISSGSLIKEVIVSSNEYITPVTWVGPVTISIRTLDINKQESSAVNYTLTKAAPTVPTSVTAVVSSGFIELGWKQPTTTSLQATMYEVRSANSGWGDSSYLWKGSNTKTQFVTESAGVKTYYIKSIDTAGEYSAAAATGTITISVPARVSAAGLVIGYADTNISGAMATISWSAPATTSVPVSKYIVELTKYPGPTVSTTTVAGTSLTVPVDWKTSVQVSIISVDEASLVSAATVKSFGKTAPSAPASATVEVQGNSTIISWVPGVKGTLPIDGYEIRTSNTGQGTPGFEFRGSTLNAPINGLSVGTNTWYIWSFDTDGQYSTTYTTVSFNVVAPSIPESLQSAFSAGVLSNVCTLKWSPPLTSQYPIKHYEVSFTYTNPTSNSFTNILNATEWVIPVSWLGSGTLSVKAVDFLGNSSPAATLVVVKTSPGPVVGIVGSVPGDYISLYWPSVASTSLPVYTYEVRTANTGWGGSGFVYKGSSTNIDIPLPKATLSTLTWYVRAIDSAGEYSTTSSYTYSITAPTAPVVYDAEYEDTSLTAATVTLFWDQSDSPYGIKLYEVSYPGYVEVFYTSTVTLPANWLGDRIFGIRAMDNLGNFSSYSYITATKLPPNPVISGSFKAQVIDNDVLLYWTLPARTTLPISHVTLRKGASWASATPIGDKDGTFTSISELSGGTYTYWIAVVDTDNNISTPVSLVAEVSQPPNFVFNAEYFATKVDGPTVTKVNAFYDSIDNSIVIPVNTVETFQQHFTSNVWSTPQNQVSAGYPYYIQPGTLSGYYQEVFDYGTTLGSSQITLSINSTSIVGNPTIVTEISVSTDGVSYTSYGASTSIFAVNFRYVKIKVTVTQTVAGDIYKISNISVRLDAKQKNDSGSVSLTPGGAHPQGSISRDYRKEWQVGSLPAGWVLNGTVVENSIISTTGPGGAIETVWACTDADINDIPVISPDGGWTLAPVAADVNSGHLFVVFMRTLANDGDSYWGTNTNQAGGVLDLGGTVNSNPYFWAGDLPTLNTWYAIVGFMHPTGYAGGYAGISGVYDMSGTKQMSGYEFKKAANCTTLGHRAYHFYNAANTGQVVQHMARPVIIPCSAAAAPSVLSYVIKCAKDYGAAVDFNVPFIDISSLNATPHGATPATVLVDFVDKPVPTGFNIFKYDTSGNPIGGIASWAATGY